SVRSVFAFIPVLPFRSNMPRGWRSRWSGMRCLLGFGGLLDVHHMPTHDAIAGALGEIDPGLDVAVGRDMTVTVVGPGRTVLLAGLDDSGALLFAIVRGHGIRGQDCAGEGEHARDGKPLK